jgi:hypothetical protein
MQRMRLFAELLEECRLKLRLQANSGAGFTRPMIAAAAPTFPREFCALDSAILYAAKCSNPGFHRVSARRIFTSVSEVCASCKSLS